MNSENIILSDLSAGYRGRGVITSAFSAVVGAGTFVCLTGRNGSGKSTLLRTIAGLLPPLSGGVSIGGQDISRLTPAETARKVSLVMTDRGAIAPQMTARELCSSGRLPYTGFFGRLTERDERIVEKAMTLTGAEELTARRVGSLSDGEWQRVMIARALTQETPVILLDEPTAFLDIEGKAAAFALMSRLAREEGKIVIAATHDIAAAIRYATDVWTLSRGESPVCDTVESLTASGRLSILLGDAGTFDNNSLHHSAS